MREVKIKSAYTGHDIQFTTDITGYDTKMIICSFGPDFSGKSRFPVTGPTKNGLVGIVPTDRKTRLTVLTAAKQLDVEGRILLPKEDLVREVNPSKLNWSASWTDVKAEEETKKHYRAHVERVKEIAWALHSHDDVRLICIDLFQQFYQDVKYAHYGRKEFVYKKINDKQLYKDTKEADQELIDFINSLSDKHLILTHKCHDEYVDDKNTGKQAPEGFKYIGNHVNMKIEHHNNRRWDGSKPDDPMRGWHYGLSVRACQWNTDIEGEAGDLLLKDEWVTFQSLAMAAFPDSSPADWE